MKTELIDKHLSQEAKEAIKTLLDAGFVALTEASLDDARELGVGMIRRTFRHAGRYDLIIGAKKLMPIEQERKRRAVK